MADWARNVLQVDRTTDFLDCFIDKKRVEEFFNSIKGKLEYQGEEYDLLIDFQNIVPVEIEEGDPYWWKKTTEAWGSKTCYAFDQNQIDEYTIEFLTAWNGVPDLMNELSRQNPDIILNYTFDCGMDRKYAVGTCIFQSGKVVMESCYNYGVDYTGAYFDKSAVHVTIPVGEKSIAKYAFIDYENLESVTIPDNVVAIESAAFASCKNCFDDFREKVTIRCNRDSYAHKYAVSSNIKFELIDEE